MPRRVASKGNRTANESAAAVGTKTLVAKLAYQMLCAEDGLKRYKALGDVRDTVNCLPQHCDLFAQGRDHSLFLLCPSAVKLQTGIPRGSATRGH